MNVSKMASTSTSLHLEEVLYQHSYLGFRLMRVRKHVHSIDFMTSIRAPPLSVDKHTGVVKNVTMDGDNIRSLGVCNRIVQLAIRVAKDTYVSFQFNVYPTLKILQYM